MGDEEIPMALHVRSFEFNRDGATHYFTLQATKNDKGVVGLSMRITYKPRKGAERFIGHAGINRGGELISRPEEIDEAMCAYIEKELMEALGS